MVPPSRAHVLQNAAQTTLGPRCQRPQNTQSRRRGPPFPPSPIHNILRSWPAKTTKYRVSPVWPPVSPAHIHNMLCLHLPQTTTSCSPASLASLAGTTTVGVFTHEVHFRSACFMPQKLALLRRHLVDKVQEAAALFDHQPSAALINRLSHVAWSAQLWALTRRPAAGSIWPAGQITCHGSRSM